MKRLMRNVLSAVGHTPGCGGFCSRIWGLPGKVASCVWNCGHSGRATRFCHAWLINSDRSVRIPRLIGTASTSLSTRSKKRNEMEGKKERSWLLVVLVNCSQHDCWYLQT